jgi:hypothetical protein
MFRYGWIGFICSVFEDRLQTVRELQDITERTIQKERKSFEEFLEGEASKLDEETKQEFYEHYQDEYFKYRDDFPTISRSSLFMNCFFSLENFLHELCLYFDKRTELKLKEYNDKGLIKYKNYLKNFVVDDHFFGTQLWEKIMFYKDLRNALAHSDGKLSLSSNTNLATKLEKEKNITVTNANEIRLNENFLDEVITTLKQFSSELYEQLHLHTKR